MFHIHLKVIMKFLITFYYILIIILEYFAIMVLYFLFLLDLKLIPNSEFFSDNNLDLHLNYTLI